MHLTPRQVNLLLAVCVGVALATGLTSWAVGTGWVRVVTAVHGIAGLSVLALAPAKVRKSVAVGMRRRPTRWLSVLFGVLVLGVVSLGVLHATGLWHGVGYWSALWTHFAAAFVVVPLLVWHVTSRPSRPRRVDLDRRLLVGGSAAVGVGAVAYGTQEVLVRVLDLDGGSRRFTGSHEVGSFDPDAMPTVSWIDDEAPADVDAASWSLVVDGRDVSVASLREMASPVSAQVDCTGGWWSEQSWDAVPLSALLGDGSGRSIEVRSATGYERLLPRGDADRLYLAVGYGGRPLRRGHGAPVRLVAPGRRGPWWVKWVTEVNLRDRPWWLQLPFPPT